MDGKKQEETTGVTIETTPENVVIENDVVEPAVEVETTEPATDVVVEVTPEEIVAKPHAAFNVKAYVGVVALILVISAGLMFVLEKEGRISTGLFSGIISAIESKSPAARVNGVVISKTDFNSSLRQLNEMAAAQGADTTDPTLLEQNRTQAIETLVNAELLRQAAVEEGMTVTPEEIETRFTEIQDGIGGAELLAERMAEFGVTEVSLRRDIENEFLIQGLFDTKIDSTSIEVSESEITSLYETAGGAAGGLPPLEELREQIEAQVRFEKEQELINTYLETLRTEAKIEVLI